MIVAVGITGYAGRMGQAIAHAIEGHPEACLIGGLVRSGCPCCCDPKEKRPRILTDNPEDLFPHCDVIVDFSHASATPMLARIAARYGKPFLSGTTGLDESALAVLKDTGQTIPVLHAANTSFSMAVARRVVELAARLLKDHDYDIAIFDKHHRWKKDAPSGTALALGQAVKNGNGGAHEPSYASLRVGAIVGEHDVAFAGQGETLTIQHVITDRRVLAQGAITAALWLAAQKPGFYGMDDVLGEV